MELALQIDDKTDPLLYCTQSSQKNNTYISQQYTFIFNMKCGVSFVYK